MQGPSRRLPWHAPLWHAGDGGSEFVPGLVRKHVEFWDGVVLQSHPLRETLMSYLPERVSVHDFLISSHRGSSIDRPYNEGRFPGVLFAIRIPSSHATFVDDEIHSLITRGCLAKWADVRNRVRPER